MEFTENQSLNIFKQVQTYRDLQDANILFLQGVLTRTPYHYGPVDPETVPLLENLITINDFGFISVIGQPALHEIKFVDKSWEQNGIIRGNWWYESEQRSFIEGYLPKAYLDIFIEFMSTQTDYLYRVYDIELSKFFKKNIKFTVLESTIPMKYFNITRERISYDRENLDQMEWEFPTNIPNTSPQFDFYDYPNIKNVLIPYTVKIIITSRKYNSGLVELLLLNFFYYLHQIMGN